VKTSALTALAAVAAAVVLPLLAWGQDASVELRPRWKPGDRQRLELAREREQTRGTAGTRQLRSRVDVDLLVLDVTPDALVVQWTFGAVRLDPTGAERDAIASEVAGLAQNLRYELELDAAGTIQRLRNWPEVKALAETAIRRTLDRLVALGVPEATRAAVREQAAALFRSEQQVLAHSLREVRLYHAAFGRRYLPGSPVVQSELLPNAFGGEPFPATSSVTLDRVDTSTRRARVTYRQAVDPDAARRIMVKTLTDLATRMGRPLPAESAIPSLSIEDVAELDVDVDTGWLRFATHRRTSRVGPNVQVDTSTITERAERAR